MKPSPIPTQDDDPPNPSAALLSFNTDSTSSTSTPSHKPTIIFISLLLITCIAILAAAAFAFLFFSNPSNTTTTPTSTTTSIYSKARPLAKLNHPVVILVSSDGLRFGYQFKTPTPNIHRHIANGNEAETGLIPVFPTLTFPNHYSIVTGLYPAHHGIVNNHFVDPYTGEFFNMGSHEPKWWLGEPLWETVVNHGLKAATYFWLGAEVKKGSWKDKDCATGWLKVNIDGAFDQGTRRGGLGIVVRDADSTAVASACGQCYDVLQPIVVEALASRLACKLVEENSLAPVIFESDCLQLVQAIYPN